jgi:2-haloacid dehalogenase
MILLLDLLMATMDSMSAWSAAAGDRERGLAWRDAVTDRMIAAGAYIAYEDLVAEAAVELQLPAGAAQRLWAAWEQIRPWPDAAAVERAGVSYGFVTNCSTSLAMMAAERSGLQPSITLSAQEAGWYKPRPEVYRLACDRMSADPAQVLFVAGAAYDALGASRAGLSAVLIERRSAERRLPGAFQTVSSMDEAVTIV